MAFLAASGLTTHDHLVGIAAVLAFGASACAARVIHAGVLTVAAAFGAAGWWTWLLAAGLVEAIVEPSARSLWVDGNAYTAATCAGLVLLSGVVVPARPYALRGATAVATALLGFLLALPALDEGGTAVGLVALVALLVWSGAAVVLPTGWAIVPAVNIALAGVPALAVTGALVVEGLGRIAELGDPFTRSADVRLVVSDTVAHPALLVPLVAALLLAGTALSGSTARALWPVAGSAVLALAAIATMASWPYAVPLAVVIGSLSALALALAVVALRSASGVATSLAASAVAVLAIGLALLERPADHRQRGRRPRGCGAAHPRPLPAGAAGRRRAAARRPRRPGVDGR